MEQNLLLNLRSYSADVWKKIYPVLVKIALSRPYVKAVCFLLLCAPVVMFFVLVPYENFLQDKKKNLTEMQFLSAEISKKKTWDKDTMEKHALYNRLSNGEHNEAAIFRFIHDAQRKSNIDLESVKPNERAHHNAESDASYKIIALGAFGNLANFLRNLSEAPVVMSFSEILIEPLGEEEEEEEKEKMLRLLLEIDIYRE